jgi:hypothetical protein
MSQASNYLENKIIDLVLRGTAWTPPNPVYFALFSTAAALAQLEAGTLTGEVAVGSYARQPVTFGAPAARSMSNNASLSFPLLTANYPDPVRFYAFMDAAASGNVLAYGQLDSDLTYVTGNTPTFDIGQLTVNFLAGASLSDYLVHALLNHVFRNTAFTPPTVRAALFGAAASIAQLKAGTLTGEVAGNGYARQAVTFGAATDGVSLNSAPVTFGPATPAGWGSVLFTALVDAASSGNVLSAAALSSALIVNLNNSPRIATGGLSQSVL